MTFPASRKLAGEDPQVLRYYIASLLLGAGLTAGCWYGIIKPALLRRENDAAARVRLATVREGVDQSRQNLDIANRVLRSTQAQLGAFNQPCWKELDRSRRLEWLYSIARGNDLEIEAVEPGDAEIAGGRRVMPLRVTGRGPFNSVVSTLHGIRATMPDFLLRSTELTGSATPGSNSLVVTLELIWVPVADSAAAPAANPSATVPASPFPPPSAPTSPPSTPVRDSSTASLHE
jgi:hypothetical protein